MPMVSPGQTLRLPNWRETWTGLASQPPSMENGRRYWANPPGVGRGSGHGWPPLAVGGWGGRCSGLRSAQLAHPADHVLGRVALRQLDVVNDRAVAEPDQPFAAGRDLWVV
jgi:hypothetical protein